MRLICRFEGLAAKNQLKHDWTIFYCECIKCNIVILETVFNYVSEVALNVNSYKQA